MLFRITKGDSLNPDSSVEIADHLVENLLGISGCTIKPVANANNQLMTCKDGFVMLVFLETTPGQPPVALIEIPLPPAPGESKKSFRNFIVQGWDAKDYDPRFPNIADVKALAMKKQN